MTTNHRLRLSIVGVIVVALFSTLFARLWFLQVAQGAGLAEVATTNRTRVVYEPALRGRILDAKGRPLVQNKLVQAITFDRQTDLSLRERATVIDQLGFLLAVSPAEVQARIRDQRASPLRAVPLATDVPVETMTYVREHQEDFPGVAAEWITVRDHPFGRLASHVLGYVGEISEEELDARAGDGYRLGDRVGKTGVEALFESQLRGEPRVQRLEVDSRGRVVGVAEERPAVPGNDVQLTIDADIQRIAEESLAQGIEGVRGTQDTSIDARFATFQAGGGSVVVLDVGDGSIVAMASAPDFDPAAFEQGVPPEVLEAYSEPDSHFPLLNRAVQGQYAPGSTWKLITAIAGLESGFITPETTINDTGCLEVGDREFCNAREREHGAVNLPRALTVSSDVYFYEIGRDMWQLYNDENLARGYATQEVAEKYGFGASTGTGLAGEAEGRIPDQTFKAEFNETNPDPRAKRENSLWLPGDSVNLSVGQGDLLVTPVQLVSAYATFANGGQRYSPRLASAVLEPRSGNEDAPPVVVTELGPQLVGETELSPATRDPVMAGLVGTASAGDGTAADVFNDLETGVVAGKTGTAEVQGKQDTSLFVGITPADAPQYAVLSVVEEGGFGATVSAPIVRRVIDALRGNLEPPPVQLNPPDATDE